MEEGVLMANFPFAGSRWQVCWVFRWVLYCLYGGYGTIIHNTGSPWEDTSNKSDYIIGTAWYLIALYCIVWCGIVLYCIVWCGKFGQVTLHSWMSCLLMMRMPAGDRLSKCPAATSEPWVFHIQWRMYHIEEYKANQSDDTYTYTGNKLENCLFAVHKIYTLSDRTTYNGSEVDILTI